MRITASSVYANSLLTSPTSGAKYTLYFTLITVYLYVASSQSQDHDILQRLLRVFVNGDIGILVTLDVILDVDEPPDPGGPVAPAGPAGPVAPTGPTGPAGPAGPVAPEPLPPPPDPSTKRLP